MEQSNAELEKLILRVDDDKLKVWSRAYNLREKVREGFGERIVKWGASVAAVVVIGVFIFFLTREKLREVIVNTPPIFLFFILGFLLLWGVISLAIFAATSIRKNKPNSWRQQARRNFQKGATAIRRDAHAVARVANNDVLQKLAYLFHNEPLPLHVSSMLGRLFRGKISLRDRSELIRVYREKIGVSKNSELVAPVRRMVQEVWEQQKAGKAA